MIAAIAVLLRIFSNSLANVFQKQLTGRLDSPFLVNFVTYALLGIVSLVFLIPIDFSRFPDQFWFLSAVIGLLGATGNGFLITAIQSGELSVLGPVNAYKSVVSIAGGMIFLGEFPAPAGLAGVACIVGGSYFVLDTTPEKFSLRLFRRRDIQYRLWAMVLAATEAVVLKRAITLTSADAAFAAWCWFGALFSFPVLLVADRKKWRRHGSVVRGSIPSFLLLALCVGVMQLSTNYAFRFMPVAYALALFQLSAIVSVAAGYHFFREKNIPRKIIGAAIMIGGSVLVIFSR